MQLHNKGPPTKTTVNLFISVNPHIKKAKNTFLVHPETKEQAIALKAFMKALKIKFEIAKDEKYKPEFVEKILQGKKDIEQGKGKVSRLRATLNLF